MPLSDAGKNLALNALKGTNPTTPITHASLHNGIPDNTGSNEITGGSPAYARKAVAFNAAATGSMDKDATDPVFDVPAGQTIFYVGFWSALTVGTFLGYAPINGGTVNGVGTSANTGDVITSYAHGLVNGDRVIIKSANGQALATGYAANVIYFVVGATTDTFQLSLTSGGAAVTISTDAELEFQKVIPETFGSQGTLTLDTATLDING